MGSIPGLLMIGVDRLDYSKGIHPRLEAYERFLAANPEWHGKITYLQITPKSRSQIKDTSGHEDCGERHCRTGSTAHTPMPHGRRALCPNPPYSPYPLCRGPIAARVWRW